jgi:hypothetical protein
MGQKKDNMDPIKARIEQQRGGIENAQRKRVDAQLEKQRIAAENAQKKKAELAKQRETKRKELQQKTVEATQKRVAISQGQNKGTNVGQQRKNPMITPLGQPILSFTSKKTPEVKKNPTIKPPQIRPKISFFGAQVPEVRNWRQNFDGSITGFIYGSRSFEDGTRVTTSPVPRGARKGAIVTTTGGTKYFLS